MVAAGSKAQQRAWALAGKAELSDLGRSLEPRVRRVWAYAGAKTIEQFKVSLAEEDDDAALGELLIRAWGTDLASPAALGRAVGVGPKSAAAAVLNSAAGQEELKAWLELWGTSLNCGSLDPSFVVARLGSIHRWSIATLCRDIPSQVLPASQGVWGWQEGGSQVSWQKTELLTIVEMLQQDVEDFEGWWARVEAVEYWHVDDGLRQHPRLGLDLPTSLLHRWQVEPEQVIATDPQGVCQELWPRFCGTARQLEELGRDLLERGRQ